MGNIRRDTSIEIETLLPGLYTLYKCSRAGIFLTCHTLERDIHNRWIQIIEEINLEMRVKIQNLDFVLVEAPYSFIMNLLIHADA